MSDEPEMNYLFYLGIIIPTLITIVLFAVFIYCWFLQKARKEVLTKKYDPHGKMRRLGMSMEPPPPPPYCRMEDSLLEDSGEDNIAYDVSRSPSTEQDAIRAARAGDRHRLYQTYHDSGISAGLGLSPSSEVEPRPGLSYRTCPDSGISGFGAMIAPGSSAALALASGLQNQQLQQQQQHPLQQQCRGCCQSAELNSPQQHQLHLGNEIQLHYEEQHMYQQEQRYLPPQQQQQQHQPMEQLQQPYLQRQPQQHQQYHPQVALHQQLMPATVHPSHGVCYGDDMTHPQSPQHYNPPPIHPSSLSIHQRPEQSYHDERQLPFSSLQTNTPMQSRQDPPPLYRDNWNPESYPNQRYPQQQELPITSVQPNLSQPTSTFQDQQYPRSLHNMVPGGNGGDVDIQFSSRGGLPSVHFHSQQMVETPPHRPHQDSPPSASSTNSSSLSSASHHNHPTTPLSSNKPDNTHSYRDSGVVSDVNAQSAGTGCGDRPDSQASQSSTTDSEDSGFRSSHCAAHHTHSLSKQGNPLLKPLRRTKNNKNKSSGAVKTSRGLNDPTGSPTGARPSLTLNPQNLQNAVADPDVIQNKLNLDLVHRQSDPRVIQQPSPGSPQSGLDRVKRPSPIATQAGVVLNQSSVFATSQHSSPVRDNNRSISDQSQQDTMIKQPTDLTDISTHLSWKYLHDISNSSNPGGQGGMLLQPCHQGLSNGQLSNADQAPMELYGYSVV